MDIPFEAYRGTEPYMFVSYTHKDKHSVYAEIKRLHDAGYRIWYDEGIPAMTKWAKEIAKAIECCEIFVVFLSPRAVASENVKDEIHLALEDEKQVLGIYLEQTELPPELRLRLSRIQGIMKYELSDVQYHRKFARTLPASLKFLAESPSKSMTVEYQGYILLSTEVDVFMELEHQLEKPIPQGSSTAWDTFGFTAKNKNVTGLGLYNRRLQSLPASLGNLSNLQTLNLCRNQLTSLPASFGNLTKLETLWLQRNQLTSLPASFFQLTNLQTLSLRDNKLTSLPTSIGNLTKLEKLDLYSNNLTSLPASFGALRNLQTLNLTGNKLASLPESFGNLVNLKELYLYNNKLPSLSARIGELTNLQSLSLMRNQLTSLPANLANLRNLRDLYLGDRNLVALPVVQKLKVMGCTIH